MGRSAAVYMGWPTRWVTRARAYGRERVPATGGLVYAINHMHWIDIPIVGALSPRNVSFVAKSEVLGFPGLGRFVGWHGTIAVRRGASDRDAVRLMRETARDGRRRRPLRRGNPPEARTARARRSPAPRWSRCRRTCRSSRSRSTARSSGRSATSRRCSIAFGEPVRFEGLPKGGRGYKEATAEIERRINVLFDWLAERPRQGPPGRR